MCSRLPGRMFPSSSWSGTTLWSPVSTWQLHSELWATEDMSRCGCEQIFFNKVSSPCPSPKSEFSLNSHNQLFTLSVTYFLPKSSSNSYLPIYSGKNYSKAWHYLPNLDDDCYIMQGTRLHLWGGWFLAEHPLSGSNECHLDTQEWRKPLEGHTWRLLLWE